MAVAAVHGQVHAAHRGGVDRALEPAQRLAESRMAGDRLRPADHDRLIRRKVPTVVLEDDEVMGGDQSVGGAADHEIDLLGEEGLVEEPEVHLARGRTEAKAVGLREAGHAVVALQELAEEADPQRRRVPGKVGDARDAEAPGRRPRHDERESVVEPERLADLESQDTFAKDQNVRRILDFIKARSDRALCVPR